MLAVDLLDSGCSAFVSQATAKLPQTPMSILDLGCGYGRHAIWLGSLGHSVTGVDMDETRARALARFAREDRSVAALVADATHTLPFRAGSFDLVLVVHFVPPELVKLTTPILRPSGYLIVETFGGNGGNWRTLPPPGRFRAELGGAFDILEYQERLVGPTKSEAVSVKLVARKR